MTVMERATARQSESLLIRVQRSVRNALAAVHKDGVMPNGFVIMQIGDPALDTVFDVAIAPAIADAGLEAKRIDIEYGRWTTQERDCRLSRAQ